MSTRTLLLLILLLVIVTLYRPRGAWRELQRVWGHREYVLKVAVTVLATYFLYGLFSMYQAGMLTWDWWR
jgi:hypothetical protein